MCSSFPKVIVQTFENYAKSQLTFVQNIAELAAKPSFVECLYYSQVVEIVLPLVTNINPTIRTNAVLSLGRLACNSELCAKQIINSKNVLNQLFGQISKENKYYKKNCMSLIKNLIKWSSGSSESLIKECGGMDAIKVCTNDFDALVREAALQALCTIARLDACFSQHIVNFGLLPLIILCLKEQSSNLKLFGLLVLDEIAKHNEDLAQRVVDSSALPHVICFLSPKFTEIKIQRHALQLIKNIVKHSLFLTESAIEASSNLFADILLLSAHPDESIRNNAAKVISEVVKHSVQIAKLVVNEGGIASMLNVIECSKELSSTPAVLALGNISAMSPLLASAVIQSKALMHLTAILKSDKDQITKAAVVWTLGMIGQHNSENSRSICTGDTITAMIDVYKDSKLEDESRIRCRTAIQLILSECNDYDVLEKLLTPSFTTEIIADVLNKISKILPKNARARRSFIVNGHLKLIQNLNPDIDSELCNIIKAVNCCFPEDIIQMIAGDFPEAVMKAVDKYVPKSQCLFYNRQLKSEEQLSKSSFSAKHQLSGEESFIE